MAQELERSYGMGDDPMLERAQVFHDRLALDLPSFTMKFPWMDGVWLTAFQNDIDAADAFPKDESVTLDIKVLTGDVKGAMQQGYAALQALGGYAKLAYPTDKARQRVFGQQYWSDAYNSTHKLQEALELAHTKADHADLKPALLDKGYTQAAIDGLAALATELQTKNGLQEAAKAGRKVTSRDRISLLNVVWEHMATVNICAGVVWVNDAARMGQYLLYPTSGSGSEDTQTMNLSGTTTHAVMGTALNNVEVTIMRATGNVVVFSNPAGQYAANSMVVTTTENVQVLFRLPTFIDRLENITLVPGEDQVLNVTMQVYTLPPPTP